MFDNTVETIPFDDTGAPFNPRDPQKVYGKPREGIKTLDEADASSNYNETPGEFARRQTPGSKENILEQMKAAYPQRYNNLTGNETAAELKGIMEKANKTDVPFSTTSKNEKKMMDVDELEDFELELGDNLEAYDFDGTVEDGARILREQKKYTDDMFLEYKKGNLDPVAGDTSPARKRFLEKKLEDMEMSGDTKLMNPDEVEELSTFDLGTDIDNAKLSVNDEIKKGVDEIMSDTSPAALKKSIEVDDLMLKYPGMSRELAKQIASDPDPARKAQVISMVEQTIKMGDEGMSGDEIIDIFKKGTDRTKQAKGGRIKMAKGGLPNILGF